MKFSAVMFDMDGVIVDSEPAHERAFITTLGTLGITMDSHDYVRYFSGKPCPQAVTEFLASRAISLDVDTIMDSKEQWYLDHAFDTISGYENTISFIKSWPTHPPYGLVTSSLRRITRPTLARYELADVFATIVTLDDIRNGKPDPEGYLLAASNLKLDTASCAVIEDSPTGVSAAKRAGMYCIALTTTHSKNQLTEADVIVDTLTPDLFE